MKILRSVLVVPLLALVACAGAPEQADTTLGSLESRRIDLRTQPAANVDVKKAIDTYEDLATSSDSGELNAKAMRSLADLEMQRLDKAFDEGDPSLDEHSYDKAIHWYQQLLVNYPRYPEREDVLYQLARAYEQSGRTDKAVRVLKLLARDYPRSSRLDEAHFRRGEILFSDGRFKEAEQAYSNVVAMGRGSQFYEQALFKYGWSIYKQDRCVDSMTVFFTLLDTQLNENMPPSRLSTLDFLDKSGKEMVREVDRVINLCLTQQEDPLFLTRYLQNKPPRAYEFLLYDWLAQYYLKEGQDEVAAKVYAGFYGRAPWHPYGVLFENNAIEIYKKLGKKDLVLQGKSEYVMRYESMKDYWDNTAHNSYFEYLVRTDKESLEQVKALLKSHLLDLANYYHAVAQKTDQAVDYRLAITWYRRYLKYFSGSADAPQINFLLAEALFEDKVYKDAALEYQRTAYEYDSHPNAVEAGYAALLAFSEYEKTLTGKAKAEWHHQAVKAALKFADTFRDDPRAPAVLVKTAEEFYTARRYDEAVKIAQRAIDRYPQLDRKLKRGALVVLANTFFEREQFDIAELYYKELVELLPKGDPIHAQAKKRLAASIYKQAEQLKAEGALPGAIDEFNRLLTVVPDTDMRPTVEFDIATLYIMLDNWDKALELLEPFGKKYPASELVPLAAEKVAAGYLHLEKHAKAAKALVDLTKTQRSPDMIRESLWKAAELYEEVGDLDNAVNTYLQYAMDFPFPLEAALEAQYRVGQIYRMQKKNFNYRVQLQKIYDADQKGGSQRTARTRYLAAQAAFELAEPLYKRYARVKLVEPIRQNMKLKDQYMKQALAAYTKAAELEVAEYTTAATYRIAEMYADFSRKLMDSERPANLNDEELEQYELMLEEQAFPFEEKAIDLHIANVDRIVNGVYDEWVKKSLESLAQFMPVRYKKVEQRDVIYSSLE